MRGQGQGRTKASCVPGFPPGYPAQREESPQPFTQAAPLTSRATPPRLGLPAKGRLPIPNPWPREGKCKTMPLN